MDRTGSEDTRLLYVTTGVLLQKLINSKNMFEYTHVILDEVREVRGHRSANQIKACCKILHIIHVWFIFHIDES